MRTRAAATGAEAKPARAPRAAPRAVKRRPRDRGAAAAPTDVVVRRVARAADDGFTCELAPGLRARADAQLLAEELAFAAARLSELEQRAAGAAAARSRGSAGAGRREEALWLLARSRSSARASRRTATPSRRSRRRRCHGRPRSSRRSRPTSAARAARAIRRRRCAPTAPGPRAADGQAAGLAGDAAWSPARRFERAFERLALPGFARAARYDFLLAAGALGLADVRPASLQLLGDPRGATVAAAKRVFAFGDPIVLERRAAELAGAAALPPGALDLGLSNWALRTDRPDAPRLTLGSRAAPDPDVRDVVLAALGADETADDADDSSPD